MSSSIKIEYLTKGLMYGASQCPVFVAIEQLFWSPITDSTLTRISGLFTIPCFSSRVMTYNKWLSVLCHTRIIKFLGCPSVALEKIATMGPSDASLVNVKCQFNDLLWCHNYRKIPASPQCSVATSAFGLTVLKLDHTDTRLIFPLSLVVLRNTFVVLWGLWFRLELYSI